MLLHPVWTYVQTFVARISFRHTLANMYSPTWAVVALIVLAPLNLNKATSQIRVREQLVNKGKLWCDVERFGDRGKRGVDE